jgi:hypothetical protein
MEQSMVLNIHVIYKAPSRELLFLGTGWGVRDVRGPYLSEMGAEIIIGNWALSQRIPSRVELTLSVSNRCEVDALFVRATGLSGSAQTLVKKNEEAILILTGILADRLRDHAAIVLQSTFGVNDRIAATPGSIDIVAINELRLIR